MPAAMCFNCKKIVLGLDGQDDALDTWCMESGDPALGHHAFGEAHQRCLIESGWGPHWAMHWRRNLERSPQFKLLYEDDSLVALAHKEVGEIHLIQFDGCRWVFHRRQFKNLVLTPYGWQLPVTDDFNLEIKNHEELFQEIQYQLLLTGEFPIIELIRRLDLEERVNSPSALLNGRLIFNSEMKEYWSKNSISVRSSYAVSIPDRIYNIWKQCTEKLYGAQKK